MEAIPLEEFLEIVFHNCFDSKFLEEMGQEEQDYRLQQACHCLIPYMAAMYGSTGRAARRAADRFEARNIVARCIQILDYSTFKADGRSALPRPLGLIACIYFAPSLHRPFYEHRLHVIAVQRYWSVLKMHPNDVSYCSTRILEHIFRCESHLIL